MHLHECRRCYLISLFFGISVDFVSDIFVFVFHGGYCCHTCKQNWLFHSLTFHVPGTDGSNNVFRMFSFIQSSFHISLSLCTLCYHVSQCLQLWACWKDLDTILLLPGNLWRVSLLKFLRNQSVSICLFFSVESLAGEIRSCQRWYRCYSTSSHRCSPTLQPTYSISALETTRSKLRFVCVFSLNDCRKWNDCNWVMITMKGGNSVHMHTTRLSLRKHTHPCRHTVHCTTSSTCVISISAISSMTLVQQPQDR